jgi:hypothetical protein
MAGVPVQMEVLQGDGQSGFVGTVLPQPVQVLVTDEHGSPVSGVPVRFRVISGGGSVGSPEVVTDGEGEAGTSWTLGETVGEQRLEITALGLELPEEVQAYGALPGPYRIVRVSGDEQSGPAGAPLSEPLVVRVVDAAGGPSAGVEVTFTVVDGQGMVEPAMMLADEDGYAQTTWTLGEELEEQLVEAGSPGLLSVMFTATIGEGLEPRVPALVRVEGNGQSGVVGQVLAAPLVVRAEDAQGLPLSGVEVMWVVSAGGGTVEPSSAVTDAAGEAETVWTLGTGPGLPEVQAQAEGLTAAVFQAFAFPELVIVAGDGQTGAGGASLPDLLVVEVRDGAGAPVADVPVVFTTEGGSLTPSGAMSGADGRVAVAWTLGPGLGEQVAEATYAPAVVPPGAVAPVVTFTATAQEAGGPAFLTILAGNDQMGVIGSPLPEALAVRVTDASGLAVAGVAVEFTVNAGGGSVSPGTALTNQDGIAEAVFTLGPEEGLHSVEVSSPGLASVLFSATARAPAQILVLAGQDVHSVVTSDVSLTVLVEDASGDPMSGALVMFTIIEGNGTLLGMSAAPVITGQDGLALTLLTLGTVAGDNVVEAAVAGLPPVLIRAIGEAGPPASIRKVEGDGLTAVYSTEVQVVAEVIDEYGNPVDGTGRTMEFTVVAGGGGLHPSTVSVTSAGTASALWLLGQDPGTNSLSATLLETPITATYVVTAVPPAISIHSGNDQFGPAGEMLASPIVVRLTDPAGGPLSNIDVTFSVISGDGWVEGSRTAYVRTDEEGLAAASWRLGSLIGAQTVQATVREGDTVEFTALALAGGPPAHLILLSGDQQTGAVGYPLADLLVVQVTDADGAGVAGVDVDFLITSEGGTLQSSTGEEGSALRIRTGSDGKATATWTLGAEGENTVEASAPGLGAVEFSATAGPWVQGEVIQGNNQEGPVGTVLPDEVRVRFIGEDGSPVSGVSVTFTVTAGGGTVGSAKVTTDALGEASTTWTLGDLAGEQQLKITAVGLVMPVWVHAYGLPACP